MERIIFCGADKDISFRIIYVPGRGAYGDIKHHVDIRVLNKETGQYETIEIMPLEPIVITHDSHILLTTAEYAHIIETIKVQKVINANKNLEHIFNGEPIFIKADEDELMLLRIPGPEERYFIYYFRSNLLNNDFTFSKNEIMQAITSGYWTLIKRSIK